MRGGLRPSGRRSGHALGTLQLLAGQPFDALDSHARVLAGGAERGDIEASLADLERLAPDADRIQGYEWTRRLLLLALAARFPATGAPARVRALATPGLPAWRVPVAMVAGGTDDETEARMHGYRDLLQQAFEGFEGTLVSGGTRDGVSGLVGGITQWSGGRIHSVGYLPAVLPADAEADPRYTELRRTRETSFSPLEPLQAWIDLVASGVPPAGVRLLGIGGGVISGAEYRIGLALGARVGVLAGSGREADRFLGDGPWSEVPNRVALPADVSAVRSFLVATPSGCGG